MLFDTCAVQVCCNIGHCIECIPNKMHCYLTDVFCFGIKKSNSITVAHHLEMVVASFAKLSAV